MAAHFYFGDWIRRNDFLNISGFFGNIGWFGVAASRDACLVAQAH